jgi:hypothetical protein
MYNEKYCNKIVIVNNETNHLHRCITTMYISIVCLLGFLFVSLIENVCCRNENFMILRVIHILSSPKMKDRT